MMYICGWPWLAVQPGAAIFDWYQRREIAGRRQLLDELGRIAGRRVEPAPVFAVVALADTADAGAQLRVVLAHRHDDRGPARVVQHPAPPGTQHAVDARRFGAEARTQSIDRVNVMLRLLPRS